MWPTSVWPASERSAAGYTALHSLASNKSKAFTIQRGFLWQAGLQWRKKKACGNLCSSAARSLWSDFRIFYVKIHHSALYFAALTHTQGEFLFLSQLGVFAIHSAVVAVKSGLLGQAVWSSKSFKSKQCFQKLAFKMTTSFTHHHTFS